MAKRHWVYLEHGTRYKEIWFWVSTVGTVTYLVRYDSLLQNATDIVTKCYSYFIADKSLLQNRQVIYSKMMRPLLQNSSVQTVFSVS